MAALGARDVLIGPDNGRGNMVFLPCLLRRIVGFVQPRPWPLYLI